MEMASIMPAKYTPNDLLVMPNGKEFELRNGNLVRRDRSFWASYVAGQIQVLLGNHCDKHSLGWVVGCGASYSRFPEAPDLVRRADVSFLRADRLSFERATEEGHLHIVPDLVAEVLSPNDLAYDVEVKVNEWLAAGVRLLWVVNPPVRQVRVMRIDGTAAIIKEDEQLSGEDVVPGFACRVGELFLSPPGAAQPTT
jgi:Uma2 family endonuclease